jgi:hypothetical protein
MGAAQRAEIRVALREVGVFLIIIGGKLWLGELWETRDASVNAQLVFEKTFSFFLPLARTVVRREFPRSGWWRCIGGFMGFEDLTHGRGRMFEKRMEKGGEFTGMKGMKGEI